MFMTKKYASVTSLIDYTLNQGICSGEKLCYAFPSEIKKKHWVKIF